MRKNVVHRLTIKRCGTFEKLCDLNLEIRRVYLVRNDYTGATRMVFLSQYGNRYRFMNPATLEYSVFHGGNKARQTNYRLIEVIIDEISFGSSTKIN